MRSVYVAGKDVKRGKRIGSIVKKCGFELAWPWWEDFDGTNYEPKGTPEIELRAVRECDILIYLYEESQLSAHYELGMALGLGKKVIAVSENPKWFLALDIVTVLANDNMLDKELLKIKKELEMESGRKAQSDLSLAKGTYRHSKSNKLYEVLGLALQTETEETLVVYRPLYSSEFELFARPYDVFTEDIELDGTKKPRFERIDI